MRLCSLIFACALLCENFVNDGHCFDLAQKDQTLACSGQTHLVAPSHPTAKELCIYASVDPAGGTSSPFQRQALYGQSQERDRSHDSAAEKLRLALPVVQGHEWEACIMLPPLWRQMVRSRGRHRRWQPSLRSVASEPTKWGRLLWTTIRDRSRPDPKARDVVATPPVQDRSRIGIAGARRQQTHRPLQMPNKRNLLCFQRLAMDRLLGWHYCRCNKQQTKQPKPRRKPPMQHHLLHRHSSPLQ